MPRGRQKSKSAKMLLTSAELVGWALGGLEREIAQTRERLAALTAQAAKLRSRAGASIRAAAGGVDTGAAASGPRRRRRGAMTAEGRKRISDMMKRRWAEAKKKNKNRL
jgi:hypothetical protein